MSAAHCRGLTGKDEKYLKTAPLLKHFYANNYENERQTTNAAQHAERIVSIPQDHAVRAFFAQQLPVHILILRCHAARRFFKTQAVHVTLLH